MCKGVLESAGLLAVELHAHVEIVAKSFTIHCLAAEFGALGPSCLSDPPLSCCASARGLFLPPLAEAPTRDEANTGRTYKTKDEVERSKTVTSTVVATLLIIAVVVPMLQYYGWVEGVQQFGQASRCGVFKRLHYSP